MPLTHWKKLCNPDYIGAYAFQPNEEKIGTISFVREEPVMGADGKKEECTVAHFAEKDLRPLILNVTNSKAITKLYGTPYIEEWAGKRIIMRVQRVKAFGDVVDAVRIKPEIPTKESASPLLCADCANEIPQYGGMSPVQLADYTKKKYGRALCAECAAKAAIEAKEEETGKQETEGAEDAEN